MAEGKKSVVVYCDWGSTFDSLDEVEAGRLIKHFFDYIRDKDPVAPDKLTQIAFEPIKQQLKRDLVKWVEIADNRSKSGRLGGLKSGEARRKQNEAHEPIDIIAKQNEPIEALASNAKQTEANEAVSVNGTVNVTETVNVKVKGGGKPSKHLFKNSDFFELEIFCAEIRKDSKYIQFDLEYYHEAVKNWSAQGNLKTNWIATAKNWMWRDLKEGKSKLDKSKILKNGNYNDSDFR